MCWHSMKNNEGTLGVPFLGAPARHRPGRQMDRVGSPVQKGRVGAMQLFGNAAGMGMTILLLLCLLDGERLAEAEYATFKLLGSAGLRYARSFPEV